MTGRIPEVSISDKVMQGVGQERFGVMEPEHAEVGCWVPALHRLAVSDG